MLETALFKHRLLFALAKNCLTLHASEHSRHSLLYGLGFGGLGFSIAHSGFDLK